MAKPTVTEADLQAGLGNLGGSFGTLTGQGPTRRDSPFGREHVRQPPVVTHPQQKQVEVTPIELSVPVTSNRVETAQPKPMSASTSASTPALTPTPTPVEAKRAQPLPTQEAPLQGIPAPTTVGAAATANNDTESTPRSRSHVVVQQPTKLKREASPTVKPTLIREVEEPTERITLPITADTRDRLTLIASTLQRRKVDKSERITPNTLIRVAVKLLINELAPGEGDAPNTEEELYELLKTRVRKR